MTYLCGFHALEYKIGSKNPQGIKHAEVGQCDSVMLKPVSELGLTGL